MKTKNILIAALLAAICAPAMADEAPVEAAAERTERRIVTRVDVGGGVVKNAPYSAEVVSERLQTLGDGNLIVNKTTSMTWRDSAGRTRTEVRDADGQVRTITIHDPVERVRWVLDPGNKTAVRIVATPEAARAAATQARAAGEQARLKVEQLRKEGKIPERTHIIVKNVRIENPVEIRVQSQPNLAGLANLSSLSSRLGPIISSTVGDRKWAANEVSRDLGTRDFNGLKAQGKGRSYEIPAGEIGNRNPITVSSESWTSPELQIMVYFKRSDPRSGESVYRLEGFKRGEPDAALFAAPSDYTIKDPAEATRP